MYFYFISQIKWRKTAIATNELAAVTYPTYFAERDSGTPRSATTSAMFLARKWVVAVIRTKLYSSAQLNEQTRQAGTDETRATWSSKLTGYRGFITRSRVSDAHHTLLYDYG